MIRKFRTGFIFASLLLAIELLPMVVKAQSIDSTSGAQTDSLCGGAIRPRRGTYIVETYPSPAFLGQQVTIQYFNLNPQVIALRVVDLLDRTVASGNLQTAALTAGGLHTFALTTRGLATGTYFIRLTTYTSSGALEQVQDARFVIVH